MYTFKSFMQRSVERKVNEPTKLKSHLNILIAGALKDIILEDIEKVPCDNEKFKFRNRLFRDFLIKVNKNKNSLILFNKIKTITDFEVRELFSAMPKIYDDNSQSESLYLKQDFKYYDGCFLIENVRKGVDDY